MKVLEEQTKPLKLFVVELDYDEKVVVAPAGSTEEELLEVMNANHPPKNPYYTSDDIRRIKELGSYDVVGKPGIISLTAE